MLTLDAGLRAKYLERLGVGAAPASWELLCRLQRAHLRTVPFHNLGLLAAPREDYKLPSLAEVARDNGRGLGGTCHLTTPSFAALLGSLGFEVQLVGGAVNHPGDHVLARVSLGGEELIVDVGNGQPYWEPFPLGRRKSWSSHGWSFDWELDSLFRRLPGGGRKRVYSVDATAREWGSFEAAIRAHHTSADFGPFRSALRAVRFTAEGMVALRDGDLLRYFGNRRSQRRVESFDAARRVLEEVFEVDAKVVSAGLEALERRCPDLFLGRRREPKILVAIPSVGRVEQLHALLETLEEDRVASEVEPGALRVVVLDNQSPTARRELAIPESLVEHTEVVGAQQVDLELERQLGLVSENSYPLSIGGARHALVRATQRWLDRNGGDWVVWMLDDDLALTQLELGGGGPVIRRSRALLAEVCRLWRERPELSIGIGTFCGDPPIPGFATWLGQIRDLQSTLLLLREIGAKGRWPVVKNDRSTTHYYYDHGGDRLPPAKGEHFLFEAAPGTSAEDVLFQIAAELPKLLAGHQVFRPLVVGDSKAPTLHAQRGGNVVFFDAQALLASPFPTFRSPDGIVSRRADSISAILCRDVEAIAVDGIDLPVLHGRRIGDRCGGLDATGDGTRRFAESQARGVALTRSCEANAPRQVAEHLRQRRALHHAGFEQVRQEVQNARIQLLDRGAWWASPAFVEPKARLTTTLDELVNLLPPRQGIEAASEELTLELTRFCASLQAKARAWRQSWI